MKLKSFEKSGWGYAKDQLVNEFLEDVEIKFVTSNKDFLMIFYEEAKK